MSKQMILVVEDEAMIALDIETLLSDSGYSDVELCFNATTAMESIERSRPSAALLDFNLGGGKTSVEVATKLLSMGIPFGFLTGYTDATVPFPEELAATPRASKPINYAELIAMLEELLEDVA